MCAGNSRELDVVVDSGIEILANNVTVDLMGFELSSVASAGPDAPPLPDNSGSGRRLVYSRAGQRVWAVDTDGKVTSK